MEANDNRRFGGVSRLFGEAGGARIAAAHVCVVGIGGVGSWAVEALARSGIGRLTLIDLDHVAESNVNRQVHAQTASLGQAKVLAMAERLAGIHPGCALDLIEEFVTPDNLAALIPRCHVVVDAIDQVKAKAALIAHCRSGGQALVTTGGAGGKTDPTLVRVADLAATSQDPLAASLRALLRRQYEFPRQGAFGIECVFSTEPIRRAPGQCDTGGAPHGLNCAGYGSSVCLTGTFGFVAADRALAAILRQ